MSKKYGIIDNKQQREEWYLRMANLFMRFPGGKPKCLTLSYDDGVINDRRLVALMTKYGLKGTFNLNSGEYADIEHDDYQKTHRRLPKQAAIELYRKSGFEVASHAVTHPFLEQLPTALCTQEILRDRRNLEADYGQIVRGFAYPYGTFNDSVVESLKACGIVYARTVWSSHSFDIPTDWLRLRPTCHHGEKELQTLTKKFVEGHVQNAPWLFYLWGHSYEFDFNDNWEIIEEFTADVAAREDIWYATNIEVYDYVQAYKQLIFNVDMTMVSNPTAFELYFEYDGKQVAVKPGETKRLGGFDFAV